MALLVLWLVIYFLIEVFCGIGRSAGAPVFAGTALATTPDDEPPISVEWELLPAVEQAADRN